MEETQPHWALWILYWLAWLICGCLVVLDILEIREASLAVVTAIQIDHMANVPEAVGAAQSEANTEQFESSLHTIDLFMFYLAAMLGISMAILIEYYFRFGLRQGKLLQRIAKVVGIQAAIILACVVVQRLVPFFITVPK
jgi:hypothetical protein